mmetsp:Transcript_19152/g.48229  ORF Transcript_19152/g.48229 Transcript_19152/m.48229 type:complete len:420 (+) Transcript_19152:328-1587(+)
MADGLSRVPGYVPAQLFHLHLPSSSRPSHGAAVPVAVPVGGHRRRPSWGSRHLPRSYVSIHEQMRAPLASLPIYSGAATAVGYIQQQSVLQLLVQCPPAGHPCIPLLYPPTVEPAKQDCPHAASSEQPPAPHRPGDLLAPLGRGAGPGDAALRQPVPGALRHGGGQLERGLRHPGAARREHRQPAEVLLQRPLALLLPRRGAARAALLRRRQPPVWHDVLQLLRELHRLLGRRSRRLRAALGQPQRRPGRPRPRRALRLAEPVGTRLETGAAERRHVGKRHGGRRHFGAGRAADADERGQARARSGRTRRAFQGNGAPGEGCRGAMLQLLILGEVRVAARARASVQAGPRAMPTSRAGSRLLVARDDYFHHGYGEAPPGRTATGLGRVLGRLFRTLRVFALPGTLRTSSCVLAVDLASA